MAFTYSIAISLGSKATGYTLGAQLVDSNGNDYGSQITSGFSEIGTGNYIWTYTGFPTGFRGGIKFYQTSTPSFILAFLSMNPEEININNIIEVDMGIISTSVSTETGVL